MSKYIRDRQEMKFLRKKSWLQFCPLITYRFSFLRFCSCCQLLPEMQLFATFLESFEKLKLSLGKIYCNIFNKLHSLLVFKAPQEKGSSKYKDFRIKHSGCEYFAIIQPEKLSVRMRKKSRQSGSFPHISLIQNNLRKNTRQFEQRD